MCAKLLHSCPHLCDPMNYIARPVPLFMGFSWQEQWSELPCPPPGDLHDSETELVSLVFPALVGEFCLTGAT